MPELCIRRKRRANRPAHSVAVDFWPHGKIALSGTHSGQSSCIRCNSARSGHNLLLVGSPGAGKTMLARRLAGLLPELGRDEALEVTQVLSAAGLLPADAGLVCERPFRAPHHTISVAGLIGGGRVPHPGEVSLAHARLHESL
jgi:predicted ATPase with chaperone activity